ncbi:MAG: hypothetical protein KAH07_03085, partial [Flavobacteriaceae bacterium]|nr:hypothetical protein [Flavobacteriaceae bacterium]
MKTILFLLIILASLSSQVFSQSDNFADKYYKSQLALSQGDAAKSLSLAYDLCENYPDSSNVWFLRSQIERQIIQYKKSLESISSAIQIEPGNPAYYYLKSSLYSDLQQYDACISYCDSVTNLDSTHLFAAILKAQALRKDGELVRALDQYYSLHKRDSLNTTFMKNIGSLHSKNDSLIDATSWYTMAIETDSTDIPAYTNLGNLYVRTEKYDEGIPVLTRALVIDTLNSWIYRFRGSLNIMGANLEDAEDDFKKAISLGDSTAFTFR